MIDYAETKPGDVLRIVGRGAPGVYRMGSLVTVTSCNGKNRVDVVGEDGRECYFALTCGAARLERTDNKEGRSNG